MMDKNFPAAMSIPAMALLAYTPHFLKIGVLLPLEMFSYDNAYPRYAKWDERLKYKSVADFIRRAESAHLNSLEAMATYAPAVLLCLVRKADPLSVSAVTNRFLKLRLVYIVLYLFSQFKLVSYARTIVWGMAVATTGELYFQALLA